MKNLKRVLSLALSGVMLVGMMAMGASAVNAEDFTDADEITHTEAVSISTALKIIDGKEDGSFDPDGYVTRGQMAKMITRAMFGGDDPVLGTKETPSFTDIKGRWDESYIEYCANNSIINGRGDGTFDPEGNVTGTEAAKMLLTALGYKADVYGLVGPDWALTTNSLANQTKVGLYDALKGLDPSKAFTRDQVAQMIYNALNAETMEMLPDMSITNGQVTYKYQPSGRTLLYDKYGAVRVEGVVTNNEFTSSSDNMKGKTTLKLSNADELKDMLGAKPDESSTIEVASGKAEFGKAVAVYVKPASANKANLNKADAISEIIVDDNDVITCVKKLSGDAKTVKSWVEKEGMELSKDVKFYLNYAATEAVDATSQNTNAGDAEFIAIDNNGDGEVEVVLKNTYTFGQVSKWDTKNEKVTVKTDDDKTLAPNNVDMDDVVAYEDIAVDDYVNVTLVADVYYIEAAEVVEGTLDAWNNDDITVDGTKYPRANDARAYTGDLDEISKIAANSVLDEEVTVYLNAFGYAVAGSTEAATDYLFVANVSWNNVASSLTSGTVNAFVYMEDGTSSSYVVNKVDGTKASKDNADTNEDDCILGKVFKYSVTSDGKLNLTAVTNTYGAGTKDVDYTKGQSTLKVDDTKVTYVTNDTVVFLVTLDSNESGEPLTTIDKVNVYTGKTAPSMAIDGTKVTGTDGAIIEAGKFLPGVAYVKNTEDNTKSDAVVFVYNETAATGNWLFLVNWVRNTGSGAIWNAIVDGELKEITTNDKGDSELTKEKAYSYEMDEDKYAIGKPYAKAESAGFVNIIDDKSIVVGTTEYDITKDTVTVRLDKEKSEVDAKITKGDSVIVVHDGDGKAEGIFIVKESSKYTADVTVADGVTGKGTSADPYVVANTVTDLAGLKAAVKAEDGATVKVFTKAAYEAEDFDASSATPAEDSDVAAEAQLVMIVTSENGEDEGTYFVKVAAAD